MMICAVFMCLQAHQDTRVSFSFLFKGMKCFTLLPAFNDRKRSLLYKSLEDMELERAVALCMLNTV